jgi:hypothetical protein
VAHRANWEPATSAAIEIIVMGAGIFGIAWAVLNLNANT